MSIIVVKYTMLSHLTTGPDAATDHLGLPASTLYTCHIIQTPIIVVLQLNVWNQVLLHDIVTPLISQSEITYNRE